MSLVRLAQAIAGCLLALAGGDARVPVARAIAQPPAYAWTAHRAVAHAFGDVDGHVQTQSAEAFDASWAEGTRLFEVDLIRAADGHVVARHDWAPRRAGLLGQAGPPRPWTLAELRARPAHGRYGQLSVEEVMALLARHPGAWLVTDTKALDAAETTAIFAQITAAARAHGVLGRVVPQLYHEAMLATVRAVHPFPSWIYTLYQTEATDDEVLAFCRREGVRAVTMGTWRASPRFVDRLAEAGVVTYVHTVNAAHEVAYWQRRGAWGFYTDKLTPRALGPEAVAGVRLTVNHAGF